ncbi:MAG: hypothetical protein M3144_08645, partial [Actinomycetota bacterium]|nr:hypothetical protein [Actinomycetota bacterium]
MGRRPRRRGVRGEDHGGDGRPGSGHELHLLSHTLHDWDEDGARPIVEGSFAALSPGGWLVDHDTHLNRDKTGPLPVARYSVLLMHTTPGRCWSVAELEALLVGGGLRRGSG